MLEEIDALPGAEREAAVVDGDGEVDAGEDGADVGGHVVGAFEGVGVEAGVFGHEALKGIADVDDDVGVVVFLDGERGGGMAAEEGEQGGGIRLGGDPLGDLAGDVVETLAAGGDGELAEVLQRVRIH